MTDPTAAEALTAVTELTQSILDSAWLAKRDAEVARAAAEQAWDQALLTAADKLPAHLQLAGEFLRGMVAGGSNPHRGRRVMTTATERAERPEPGGRPQWLGKPNNDWWTEGPREGEA